ncbi:MAG: DedA family protein [Nitrososphaerales archaeon]
MVDVTDIFPIEESLGYLGLLIISFLGSVVVFLPLPFFVFLAALSIDPLFDPNVLALISAAGATGGKMVIFYGSYYGRRALKDETKRRMRPLQRLVSRYGWVAAFVAAATPIPDDLVYIPLGLSKYNPMLFLGATFGGKVVLSEGIAWTSRSFGFSYIEPFTEGIPDVTTLYIYSGILAAVMAGIIYYTVKIDWSKTIGKRFPWTLKDDEESKDKKT